MKLEEKRLNHQLEDKKLGNKKKEFFDQICNSSLIKEKCEKDANIYVSAITRETALGEEDSLSFDFFFKYFNNPFLLEKMEKYITKKLSKNELFYHTQIDNILNNSESN